MQYNVTLYYDGNSFLNSENIKGAFKFSTRESAQSEIDMMHGQGMNTQNILIQPYGNSFVLSKNI